MLGKGVTVSEATHRWVQEFNRFPQDMISKLMSIDVDGWHEVTKPSAGRRVYVFNMPDGCDDYKNTGEIENFLAEADVYLINPDDGNTVEVGENDFELEEDSCLPMWGTMWQFGDSFDDYWLEEMDGIRVMSECGFRIYESDVWGYFFGIDGCGYDFYSEHWIPLYRKRGLRWHDPETEKKEEDADA